MLPHRVDACTKCYAAFSALAAMSSAHLVIACMRSHSFIQLAKPNCTSHRASGILCVVAMFILQALLNFQLTVPHVCCVCLFDLILCPVNLGCERFGTMVLLKSTIIDGAGMEVI